MKTPVNSIRTHLHQDIIVYLLNPTIDSIPFPPTSYNPTDLWTVRYQLLNKIYVLEYTKVTIIIMMMMIAASKTHTTNPIQISKSTTNSIKGYEKRIFHQ